MAVALLPVAAGQRAAPVAVKEGVFFEEKGVPAVLVVFFA